MNPMFLNIAFILLASGFAAPPVDEPDPERMIEETKLKFSSIRDFTAEVEIEINVHFINVPDKKARIFYKYPDKLKFKSKSFLLIPKKGIGFTIFELLENKYASIYIGKRLVKGRELNEIKVIPLDEGSDIALATLFIEPDEDLIYYMEATTRNSGFFTSEFEYGSFAPLPESNRIRFEVDEVRMPLKFMGKTNIDQSKMKEGAMGEVILRFHDYEINRGLVDEQFGEEYGEHDKDAQ